MALAVAVLFLPSGGFVCFDGGQAHEHPGVNRFLHCLKQGLPHVGQCPAAEVLRHLIPRPKPFGLTRYLAARIRPVPAPDNGTAFRVGIISPYTAQASLTRKLLKQMPLASPILNPNEDIGTVHGFQGDECNLVIALLSPPPTTGERIMLNQRHIINVAVSRARDRLVLLVPAYEDARANGAGLRQLQQLFRIIKAETEGDIRCLAANEAEEALFGPGSANFILSNSFATSHQLVNVYGPLPATSCVSAPLPSMCR